MILVKTRFAPEGFPAERKVRMMGHATFTGGIHPRDGKELAKDQPLRTLLPKGELVYPLSQHIGAPAVPLVAVGDSVQKGQVIASANGFVSAPVHASVSGTVKAIEKRMNAQGVLTEAIVVENDGLYTQVDPLPVKALEAYTPKEILDRIGEAGIVGMGGAGFPSQVKLSPKDPSAIDTIIANCAECEPYITCDHRRMLENTRELVEGLRVVLQIFPQAKGILGVEDNKPACIEALQREVGEDPRIRIQVLRTKYPQGGERQLIYACTGRKLSSDKLPADVGVIVDNAETLIAIFRAVLEGRPCTERAVTISGDALEDTGNFLAPLGISHKELVEACGGYKEEPKKLISGGPMMGFALLSEDIPVTKTTSALLAFREDVIAKQAETPCINCGRCVEVCPSRLIPSRLADYAIHHREERFTKWYGQECIECGCCSYVCPAKRPLKQAISSMKKLVTANRKKQEAR